MEITKIAKYLNFTGENFNRNQRITPVEAQQPKTKPDDAIEILRCCETLAGQRNASTSLAPQL